MWYHRSAGTKTTRKKSEKINKIDINLRENYFNKKSNKKFQKKKKNNCPKWSKIMKNGQNGQISKMGEIVKKKWSKMVKIGKKLSIMVKNCQKWSKMAGLTFSGPDVPALNFQ